MGNETIQEVAHGRAQAEAERDLLERAQKLSQAGHVLEKQARRPREEAERKEQVKAVVEMARPAGLTLAADWIETVVYAVPRDASVDA